MSVFRTTREFSAAPEAVFAAMAAPERLARWWGPAGFSNTFDVFEFVAGGAWRFTMHGPDGTDYANESEFLVVEPGRRVVIRHLSQPHFELTVRLSPSASGTQVSWEQAFESADVAAAVRQIVEPANEQNLDRWEAEVRLPGGL